MKKFDYGSYFGPIIPLADALRESTERFWEPTREELSQPHEYVLHLGCNVLRTVHLAESLVAVLKAMQVDFITLGGSTHCCGVIHQFVGDQSASLKIGQKTLNTFASFRPKNVLIYCPTCNSVFDGKLASGELRCDAPYQQVTQFLAEHLSQIPFKVPIKRRVALHMHQSGARAKGDSAHTLAILRAVPGLEVVELIADDEWGYNCAPPVVEKLGVERHRAMVASMCHEAKASGCDGLATVYHSCYRDLMWAELEHGLEWLNYIELLAAALGVGPFPPLYKALRLAGDADAAYATLAARSVERGGNLVQLRRSVDEHFSPGSSPGSVKRT